MNLLTIAQAAKQLTLSRATIYRMIQGREYQDRTLPVTSPSPTCRQC